MTFNIFFFNGCQNVEFNADCEYVEYMYKVFTKKYQHKNV